MSSDNTTDNMIPKLILNDVDPITQEDISHIVSHRNRSSGVSKYSNWQRFRVGLVDLYGVSWLIRRSSFPIKLKDENK